ncbi:MAG TPA: hypothetical protein VGD91_29785, partial [Trebonia sp.]
DPAVPGEPKEPALEPLSSTGVARMLEHVQDNPLGNKPGGGKTSLAGVQDKIVLARTEAGWNRVIDGTPVQACRSLRRRGQPRPAREEPLATASPRWVDDA